MPHEENNNKEDIELIPDVEFSEDIEQLIFSYFDNDEVLAYAGIDKGIWKCRMEEEINRRQEGVTIYTWLEGESSLAIRKTETDKTIVTNSGHSALKTWGGGKKGKGVYVSFYPGNCNTAPRIPSCREAVSHFHTWSQEFATIKRAISINLYGLDIEAINNAFYALCDESMRSHDPWSLRYNCSDVVLSLLEKGGLFEKITFNPLGTISIMATSIIHSTLLRAFYEALFRIKNVSALMRSKPFLEASEKERLNPSQENSEARSVLIQGALRKKLALNMVFPLLKKIFLDYLDPSVSLKNINLVLKVRCIGYFLMSGFINVPVTSIAMYLFSYLILTKPWQSLKNENHSDFRRKIIHQICKLNAFKSATILALEPLVSYGISFFLGSVGIDSARGSNFVIFNLLGLNSLDKLIALTGLNTHRESLLIALNRVVFAQPSIDLPSQQRSYLDIRFRSPAFKDLFISFMLIGYVTALAVGLVVSSRYLYDTTTTPLHVLNIAKKISAALPGPDEQPDNQAIKQGLLSRAYSFQQKHKMPTYAAAMAALGLFAYKNKERVFNFSEAILPQFNPF